MYISIINIQLNNDLGVLNWRIMHPPLQDVFMHLLSRDIVSEIPLWNDCIKAEYGRFV